MPAREEDENSEVEIYPHSRVYDVEEEEDIPPQEKSYPPEEESTWPVEVPETRPSRQLRISSVAEDISSSQPEEDVLPSREPEDEYEEDVLPSHEPEDEYEEAVLPPYEESQVDEEDVLPSHDPEDEEENVLPPYEESEVEEEKSYPTRVVTSRKSSQHDGLPPESQWRVLLSPERDVLPPASQRRVLLSRRLASRVQKEKVPAEQELYSEEESTPTTGVGVDELSSQDESAEKAIIMHLEDP